MKKGAQAGEKACGLRAGLLVGVGLVQQVVGVVQIQYGPVCQSPREYYVCSWVVSVRVVLLCCCLVVLLFGVWPVLLDMFEQEEVRQFHQRAGSTLAIYALKKVTSCLTKGIIALLIAKHLTGIK